jgi:hypothetical protein
VSHPFTRTRDSELDEKLTEHDQAIAAILSAILSAIRKLMHLPAPKRQPIGFIADLKEENS